MGLSLRPTASAGTGRCWGPNEAARAHHFPKTRIHVGPLLFLFHPSKHLSWCREESLISFEPIPKQDIESPTAPGPLALAMSRCFTQVPSSTYCPESQGALGGGLESRPGHRRCGGQPWASPSFQEPELFPPASPALSQPSLPAPNL